MGNVQPLFAVIVLTLPDGTEIYRSAPVENVMPGDTVNWTFPKEGLFRDASTGLPVTLRHGESAAFTVTETYPPPG